MEPEFWHRRWELKQIAFHEPSGNALLAKWFYELGLVDDQRIFVPLCGKTRDIAWLLSQRLRVVGAELSEKAVRELFQDLEFDPVVSTRGTFKLYSGPNLDVFVGDFFNLSAQVLGLVDAIYDRAALVAMPGNMRGRYCENLVQITSRAPQLLISFAYDQSLMNGPPFSVDAAQIASHYAAMYELRSLEIIEVPGGLKGVCSAHEQIWCLS